MKKIALFVLIFVFSFATSAMTADKVVVVPLLKSVPSTSSTSKIIFVTTSVWTGDLGGLSGADEKCNVEAKSHGLSGTYQALLGSAAGRPATRSIHYPLPYFSETAAYLNSDFHDLFNSGPDNPVNSNPLLHAWTGLTSTGMLTGEDCNGWTDSSSGSNGSAGKVDAVGSAWLNDSSPPSPCSEKFSLYCIEQ